MSTPDFSNSGMDYDDPYMQELSETKILTLTRNEALYLSDSVTLVIEHDTEQGKIVQIPSRSLILGVHPKDLILSTFKTLRIVPFGLSVSQ